LGNRSYPSSNDDEFPEPTEAVLRFQKERGYSYLLLTDEGEPAQSDYDSYSNDVLEKLAKAGDIEAAMRLSRKIYLNEEEFPKAYSLSVEASVNGFSARLIDLGNMMKVWSRVTEKRGNSEQARKTAKESAAWFKTAILRGDPTGLLHYDPSRQTNQQFTSAEQAEIDALANQSYENLANERKKEIYRPLIIHIHLRWTS
jgi:hypothetical protein